MYKISLIAFSLFISLFLISCSSDDSNNSGSGDVIMNENNCYLDYVKLDAVAKASCDTWIENNK